MKNILAFVALSILSFSVKAQEIQGADSVEYGRFFLGMDVAPVVGIMTGNPHPQVFMQLKSLSLKDPCNRLRITYQHITEDGNKRLSSVIPGNYNVVADSFQLRVNTNGTSRYFVVGLGYERAKHIGKFDVIYGADAVLGRRMEEISDEVVDAWFASDSAQTVFYTTHSNYTRTTVNHTIYGVAPFAGIEMEIGERFSIQTSIRSIASYDKYSNRSSTDGWSDPHLNLKDRLSFRCTGVNVLLFLRF